MTYKVTTLSPENKFSFDIDANVSNVAATVEKHVNDMGVEGWRLVSVVNNGSVPWFFFWEKSAK